MATINGKRFTLDSSLDLPADSFSVEIAGTQDYRDAGLLGPDGQDTVSLKAGYTDAATSITYQVGSAIGPVDEYEITVTPTEMTCRVNGRDKMAELIGRKYQMKYLRVQPTVDQVADFDAADLDWKVGAFTAKDIAADVAVACGLSLTWLCRDYILHEDFDASGRCLDILKRLVEPWAICERFKVDVLVQGTVLICRPRPATLVADYAFNVKDARIKSITLRRRRGTRYGRVTLLGKLVAKTTGGGGVYQPYEVEETSTSETKDQSGAVIQRVIRTTAYRMPEKIPLRSREQTFDKQGSGLKLVKDEQRDNDWETIQYSEAGASKNPRQLFQRTNVNGIHPNDKSKTFRNIRKEEVSFSYDTDGYQDMTTTRKWELNVTRKTLDEMERVVRVQKEAESLKTEEVTTVYKKGKSNEFYLASMETNVSAGVRPGGPRPGRTIVSGGSPTGPTEPISLEAEISTHVWADDFTYSNPNMEAADLTYLLSLLQTASGQWEYEMSVMYVAMPWLRKGNVVQVTGLLAENGVTAIPMGPALIVNQSLNYDEGGESPQMVSRLTAVWWG